MLTRLFSRSRAPRSAAPVRSAPQTRWLGVEALEARELPALVLGVTNGNTLVEFNSTDPTTILRLTPVSGFQVPGEQIIGMDYRPRTGKLYASTVPTAAAAPAVVRTYTIDDTTGVATFVGATASLGTAADLQTGYNFNPVSDRIRVVQSNDGNARLNPTNGALTANDTALTYNAPATNPVIAAAYDRSYGRSFFTPTTLYVIDAGTSSLAIQGAFNQGNFSFGANSPNGGVITDIGALGITLDAGAFAGFDIGAGTANGGLGEAFATFTVGGVTSLYSIDLGSGVATLIGAVSNGATQLRAIAIEPIRQRGGLLVGSGPGAAGDVRVLDATTGAVQSAFTPYGGYLGGVKVAYGDVNGDGVADVVTNATIPGGHIKAFDGVTGKEIMSFFAYAGFLGDVNIAVGDVDGDGFADIIAVANAGQGHVKVFSGQTASVVASFLAYPGFGGNVTIAAGDFDKDGVAEIVTIASGAGTIPGAVGGGRLKVFNSNGSLFVNPLLPAFANDYQVFPGFFDDVNVAVGDLTGDGRADIVVATSKGPGHIKVLDGFTGNLLASFLAFGSSFASGSGGAFVALSDANGDRKLDIRVTPGPGLPADVTSFDLFGRPIGAKFPAFTGFRGGAYVAGPNT